MSIPDRMARTGLRLLRDGMQDYAARALKLAQRGAGQAAQGIETAEPRLTALTEASLEVAEVSCRCFDRLVRQSLQSAREALADGTDRLRMTARARDLVTLYDEQRAALPASRERITREIEATWKIMTATGRELAQIAQSTRDELFREPGAKRARRKGAARARKTGRAGRPRSRPPTH